MIFFAGSFIPLRAQNEKQTIIKTDLFEHENTITYVYETINALSTVHVASLRSSCTGNHK